MVVSQPKIRHSIVLQLAQSKSFGAATTATTAEGRSVITLTLRDGRWGIVYSGVCFLFFVCQQCHGETVAAVVVKLS